MARRDWDAVLATLSDLILFKNKADALTWRDAFENMDTYMQRLGIEEEVKKLSIIHVAGTKGKGSTCAMVESMLRHCGYRTGLYTSPHLVDVRERVRVDGRMCSKEVFEENFWWCYERFKEAATPEVGVPGYFRFMTLLALKIMLSQKVDVVLLEVGVGGRLDATNVIRNPVVCGITSLGMDHMEMLGDTLPKIAREKAGILKPGVPGFTVPQEPEAMDALQDCAAKAGTELRTVQALDPVLASHFSLGGAHMLLNAGLAVKLASEWERRSEAGQRSAASAARLALLDGQQSAGPGGLISQLPAEYLLGLQSTQWPGRSQIVPDAEVASEDGAGTGSSGGGRTPDQAGAEGTAPAASRLTFFIDGAHTPESMATCADWFADKALQGLPPGCPGEVMRVLLFNCMKERDPATLLPTLTRVLSDRNLHFQHAVFVPSYSQYGYLPCKKEATPDAAAGASGPPLQVLSGAPPAPDYGWQLQMQQIWDHQCASVHLASKPAAPGALPPLNLPENLIVCPRTPDANPRPSPAHSHPPQQPWSSAVLPSLAHTLDWLRQYTRSSPRVQVQVLVTGSLYLVGDLLKLLGRLPK